MYFSDVLGVLVRRWLVIVIGAAVTLVACAGVVSAVPTTHQATGQLLLLLPAEYHGKDTPTNPYLNLPGELTTTASLLASSVMTKDTVELLAEDGIDSVYDVALVPGAGPLLYVSVRDVDADAAIETRDAVVEMLTDELVVIQEESNAPAAQTITLRPFSMSSTAEALSGSKLRALAVVGGAGALLTVLLAFALDARARSRAARPRGPRRSEA